MRCLKDLRQFIPQSVCLKCNGCCRFATSASLWSPAFLDEEQEAFAKKKIPLYLRKKSKKSKLIPFKEGYICQFFNPRKNTCKIYKFRPLDCRLYPFLLRKVKKKNYLALDLNCPYIQETYTTGRFNAYLKQLLKFLSLPKIKRLIQNNPQIIGRFREKGVINLFEICL